jgi:hypothetical protein
MIAMRDLDVGIVTKRVEHLAHHQDKKDQTGDQQSPS